MIDPQVESDAVIAHRQALTGLTPAQRRAIVIEVYLGDLRDEGLHEVIDTPPTAHRRQSLERISHAIFSRGFDE